ncbi:MAG: DUF1501 domain-containing protein [Oscillatoriales cyanobacterium SM2_2_1]|nr:DUF1501 domain-containing protein [Oscillatoriales cyanobacterium SM2_2_1]
MNSISRRTFLETATVAALLVSLEPLIARPSSQRTLLIIELAGGNDTLNTFIPYRDRSYWQLRPTLGIKDGIPVSDQVAFHPALKDWKPLFDQGKMAIIQNVGYPNFSLSHFRAKDIWQSATPQGSPDSGWLGRYLESTQARAMDAIFLGDEYPLALMGKRDRYLQLSPRLGMQTSGKLGQALQAVYGTPQGNPLAEKVRRSVLENQRAIANLTQDLKGKINLSSYPKNRTGQQMALVRRMIAARPDVIYLAIGGWDTHANQPRRHQALLEQLSTSISALYRDLQAQGLDRQVLTLVQTEFGRRPAENGSSGT